MNEAWTKLVEIFERYGMDPFDVAVLMEREAHTLRDVAERSFDEKAPKWAKRYGGLSVTLGEFCQNRIPWRVQRVLKK